MQNLRQTYGPDAIILEHRQVKARGLWGSGLFARKSYELEYMLTEDKLPRDDKQKTLASGALAKYAAEPISGVKRSAAKSAKLRQLVEILAQNTPSTAPNTAKSQASAARKKLTPAATSTGAYLQELQKKLSLTQLSPAFASDFFRQLEEDIDYQIQTGRTERSELTQQAITQKALAALAERIPTALSKAPPRGQCRAFMLMGATGSGKSTSIAKLAARYHIVEQRMVSIYSLDHYRLAATEQLKSYANVMSIPFYAPLNQAELSEALQRDGAEVILIDTSGVTWRDKESLQELGAYVRVCRDKNTNALDLECSLVLAASMNPALVETLVAAFAAQIDFDKIILTKVDESKFIGAFVEIADRYNRPFSFLTDGQVVPADIRVANGMEMAKMIWSTDLAAQTDAMAGT